MSITTKMKIDRASVLLNNAVAELTLAARELSEVRPSDASADAAHDIGQAIEGALPLIKACARSAFELNSEVQKR